MGLARSRRAFRDGRNIPGGDSILQRAVPLVLHGEGGSDNTKSLAYVAGSPGQDPSRIESSVDSELETLRRRLQAAPNFDFWYLRGDAPLSQSGAIYKIDDGTGFVVEQESCSRWLLGAGSGARD